MAIQAIGNFAAGPAWKCFCLLVSTAFWYKATTLQKSIGNTFHYQTEERISREIRGIKKESHDFLVHAGLTLTVCSVRSTPEFHFQSEGQQIHQTLLLVSFRRQH